MLTQDLAPVIGITGKAIIKDGEVHAVEIFGISESHPETVRDIAQQIIDATYGSNSHKRLAIFTHEDWQNMRRDEPKMITVRVHTY